MNFPVNVPKETWKRKWVMIVKSCFCSLLLRLMLHVQKSTIPELWIFHWNFTVCMWLQPEGCTETSVYDASQQNKPQHGLNLIPRSPYATQLYLCLNVFAPISQIYDNPSRSTWENVNSATFSLRNVGITWNCVKVKMCKYFVVLGSSAGEATPTGPEWKSTNETAFWKIFTVDWHLSCSSCRFVAPSPAQVQLQPVLLAQTGLKGTGDTRGSPSQGTSVPNDDPENPSHTHTHARICVSSEFTHHPVTPCSGLATTAKVVGLCPWHVREDAVEADLWDLASERWAGLRAAPPGIQCKNSQKEDQTRQLPPPVRCKTDRSEHEMWLRK